MLLTKYLMLILNNEKLNHLQQEFVKDRKYIGSYSENLKHILLSEKQFRKRNMKDLKIIYIT